MENGIYIYNSLFSEYNIIFSFKDSQKISNSDDYINTIISEIKSNNINYIVILSKKYLYIYDSTNQKKYEYYLNDLNDKWYSQSGVIYNLLPYEFQNNYIKFIISFAQENGSHHKLIFLD